MLLVLYLPEVLGLFEVLYLFDVLCLLKVFHFKVPIGLTVSHRIPSYALTPKIVVFYRYASKMQIYINCR